MPKTDRFRALYVLNCLWENTDEEHPVTLVQIQNHLSQLGIEAIPKTIDGDTESIENIEECYTGHNERLKNRETDT